MSVPFDFRSWYVCAYVCMREMMHEICDSYGAVRLHTYAVSGALVGSSWVCHIRILCTSMPGCPDPLRSGPLIHARDIT